ncbi:MAG TPA: C2H2-type zinc finger protein [Nitrososphaeraceae archaeon]|nr:C2H2-type zinc finger protein [Nitrososphaeraceae archaeon]
MLLKRNKCQECGRSFRKIEELMQHQQVVHGKDKAYRCNSCGLEYFGMEQMRAHIMKYHSYGDKKI